jgi:hopene-associated glycosyltransferase HpnB
MNFSFWLGFLSLLIWAYLLCGRAGYWRVQMLKPSPEPASWPEVVVIIPARDEAQVIEESLRSVLLQDYPGPWSVILVDDHSEDGTAALARRVALECARSEKLDIVAARTLPAGWAGKVWAQAEGLVCADRRGDFQGYVWLTDADISHPANALRELIASARAHHSVLTSLMVRLRCESLPERALIPAFVYFFAMLYPFGRVNEPARKTAAAAGGCMLVERRALREIGGMAAIQGALIDDCALAQALKRVGPIRLELAQASRSIRRYASWRSIWEMIARSAFTQLDHSAVLLATTLLGMTLTYLVPVVLTLLFGFSCWPAALAWLLMSLSYCPMLLYYRQPPLWAPLLPLVALFYLGATLDSARRHWRGEGGRWKGRTEAALAARGAADISNQAPPPHA